MYGRVPDEVHQDPHARSHWSVALWLAAAARGALVLNPTPFAQRSTPQQADHQTEARWPLPSLAQTTHSHQQMREPRRPFGRLAMTDGMDRLSWWPSAAARAGDT